MNRRQQTGGAKKRLNRIRLRLSALALSLALFQGASLAQDGFRVIVHESNSQTSISKSALARMFLKKTKKWPHGSEVSAIDQRATNAIRDEFTTQIHGKRPSAILAFWQKMIFSGRETPLPEAASDREVVQYVRALPGAGGYVSTGARLGPGVKVLPVIDG